MISPDIKDLMRNMDSRYTLVITAAKRARQLTGGAEPLTRFRSDKPVTLAIHEIAEGKVDYFREGAALSDYIGADMQGRVGASAYASVFYDDADGSDAPPYMDGDEQHYISGGSAGARGFGEDDLSDGDGIVGAGADLDDDGIVGTGADLDDDDEIDGIDDVEGGDMEDGEGDDIDNEEDSVDGIGDADGVDGVDDVDDI